MAAKPQEPVWPGTIAEHSQAHQEIIGKRKDNAQSEREPPGEEDDEPPRAIADTSKTPADPEVGAGRPGPMH